MQWVRYRRRFPNGSLFCCGNDPRLRGLPRPRRLPRTELVVESSEFLTLLFLFPKGNALAPALALRPLPLMTLQRPSWHGANPRCLLLPYDVIPNVRVLLEDDDFGRYITSRDKKSLSSGGHDVSGALCRMSLVSCSGGLAELSKRSNIRSITSSKILALWSPRSDEVSWSSSTEGISERTKRGRSLCYHLQH